MFTKEQLNKAAEKLGKLTEAQTEILAAQPESRISEQELYHKLGVEESKFAAFMSALREQMVFSAELSEDELLAAAGGSRDQSWNDSCTSASKWNIYEPSFPSCNASVESGSWCKSSDACYADAIVYQGMRSCKKAWE